MLSVVQQKLTQIKLVFAGSTQILYCNWKTMTDNMKISSLTCRFFFIIDSIICCNFLCLKLAHPQGNNFHIFLCYFLSSGFLPELVQHYILIRMLMLCETGKKL